MRIHHSAVRSKGKRCRKVRGGGGCQRGDKVKDWGGGGITSRLECGLRIPTTTRRGGPSLSHSLSLSLRPECVCACVRVPAFPCFPPSPNHPVVQSRCDLQLATTTPCALSTQLLRPNLCSPSSLGHTSLPGGPGQGEGRPKEPAAPWPASF